MVMATCFDRRIIMCDAGMDGDRYDRDTSSGKWHGSEPSYNQNTEKWEWEVDTPRETSRKSKLARIWDILRGE